MNPELINQLEIAHGHICRHDFAKGLELFELIYQQDDNSYDILRYYGYALRAAGKLLEAAAILTKATVIYPNEAWARRELGLVHMALGQHNDALQAFQTALNSDPFEWKSAEELGLLLEKAGKLREAVSVYQYALARCVIAPRALERLSHILFELELKNEAASVISILAVVAPNAAEVFKTKDWTGAEVQPNFDPNQEDQLVDILSKITRDPNTLREIYERLITHHPNAMARHLSAIEPMLSLCDWRNFDRNIAMHLECLMKDPSTRDADLAFTNLPSVTGDPKILRDVAQRLSHIAMTAAEAAPLSFDFANRRDARTKIRIAYAMPYARESSLGYGLREFLKCHDRSRFEIVGYVQEHLGVTEFAKQLEGQFDACRSFADHSDAQAAEQIHADQIDILLDCCGHTIQNFQGILAYRPAPVQCNFYGFVETTGAPYMDYLISDERQVPEELAALYTEQLVYMPDSLFVAPSLEVNEKAYDRAQMGLLDGAFVFCNFNHPRKFNPALWDIWMTILKKVPHGMLWIGLIYDTLHTRKHLLAETQARGVDPNRLVFATGVDRQSHVNRLGLADLCLDTNYHSGGINAVDSVLAGVPILGLSGRTSHSRNVVSIMETTGLEGFITDNADDYIARAVHLAGAGRGDLEAARQKLIEDRQTSPLFDFPGYVQHLEWGYNKMWQGFLDSKDPATIHIPNLR